MQKCRLGPLGVRTPPPERRVQGAACPAGGSRARRLARGRLPALRRWEDQPSAHPGEPGPPGSLAAEWGGLCCALPTPTVGLSFLKHAFAVSFFSPATHCPFCP